MIYNMKPETVGAYTLHFEDLDGDRQRIELAEEGIPQWGPDGIMRMDYLQSGKRVNTDHLPTKLRPNRKKSKLPDYAISGHAQICTTAFRDVVEAHDPEKHQFVPVQIVWKDGAIDEAEYFWLIPGVRLRALNPTESNPALNENGSYIGNTSKANPRPGPVQPVFLAELVGDNNLFVEAAMLGAYLFVTERLKNALDQAEMTGVGFGDPMPVIG